MDKSNIRFERKYFQYSNAVIYKCCFAAAAICIFLFCGCNNDGNQNATDSEPLTNAPKDTAAIKAMGKEVYTSTCAACHGNPAIPKAASFDALSAMEPRAILNALENGKMRQQASKLTDEHREAVAQYITGKMLKTIVMPKEAFTKFSFNDKGDTLIDYSGWGGNLESTGFRSTEQAGITTSNVGTLALKWSFSFPDQSDVRSKPAIADDWLIVGSQSGDVYALNRFTGKIGWRVTAGYGIRGSITIARDGERVTAYFADGATYTYAVDVKSGKILWSNRAGSDPLSMCTGTVAVYGGKVFVPISSVEVAVAADSNYNCCTSSGAVAALDSKTGDPIWYHRVVADTAKPQGKKSNGKPFYGPSGAPVWCSPTVDTKRGLIYIGTGENYSEPTTNTSDAIQAIDINTGNWYGTSRQQRMMHGTWLAR